MKKLLITILLILSPTIAYAQLTVSAGGTGTTSVPANYVLIGKDALHLTAVSTSSLGIISGGTPGGTNGQIQVNLNGTFAGTTTNPLVVGSILATSTTATSSLPHLTSTQFTDTGLTAGDMIFPNNNHLLSSSLATVDVSGNISGFTYANLLGGFAVSSSGGITGTSILDTGNSTIEGNESIFGRLDNPSSGQFQISNSGGDNIEIGDIDNEFDNYILSVDGDSLQWGQSPDSGGTFTINSNGRMGLGDALPSYNLDINNAVIGTGVDIGDSNSNKWLINSNGAASFAGGSFVLLSNGNVGIGSSTPGLPLSVLGNSFLGGTLETNGSVQFKSLASSTNPCLSTSANGTIGLSACQGGSGGGGTVTSVGLALPTGFTISGSPITSSGTLTGSLMSGYIIPQSANLLSSTTVLTVGNLLYSQGTNQYSSVATSSETCSGNISCTAHTVVGSGGGAITFTGTLPVSSGGTGQTSFIGGNLIYGNGSGALSNVATSSVSCTSGVSCTGFSAVGTGSTITNTGVLSIGGLTGTVSTSSLGLAPLASTTALNGGTGITYNPFTGTIANSGVTSIVAGSNISISGSTGAVTINASGGGAGGGLASSTPWSPGALTYVVNNSSLGATSSPTANYFVATTTTPSIFPFASTTVTSASSFCFSATCVSTPTISGTTLGGTLPALTATDGTLSFSLISGYNGSTARTVGLNLANGSNVWTAASTTYTGHLTIGSATSTTFGASAYYYPDGSIFINGSTISNVYYPDTAGVSKLIDGSSGNLLMEPGTSFIDSAGSAGSAGNVLSISGGVPKWVATSTLNIAGGGASLSGGTANLLTSWTSATTVTATSAPQVSAIFATSTTATSTFAGAVGIGSSTPQFTLGVVGTSTLNGDTTVGPVGGINAFIIARSGFGGFGTSSPYASLSVVSGASTGTLFALSTTTGQDVTGYDNSGHKFTSGSAPAVSSCGSGSPTVVGDDQGGTITTGTAATSCTLTFATPYAKSPYVSGLSDNSATVVADVSSISTTAVTFNLGAGLSGGQVYYSFAYHR